MTVQPGEYLHRSESRIDRNGDRIIDHFRRQVTGVTKHSVTLGQVEKASTLEDEAPTDWTSWGGVLGGPSQVTHERLRSLDYKTRRRKA